jgi:hypothetical protein
MASEPPGDGKGVAEPELVRPGDRPREGASVVRLSWGPLDHDLFAPPLMKLAGMVHAEAVAVCAHGYGIVLDNVAPEVAQWVADAFSSRGERCIVVLAAEVAQPPKPKEIHGVELTKVGLIPRGPAGPLPPARWDEAVALAAGHVVIATPHTAVDVWPTGGMKHPVAVHSTRVVKTEAAHAFADFVFGDDLKRYRIDVRQFDFSVLGKERRLTVEASLHVLLRWFVYTAAHVSANFDVQALIATGEIALPRIAEHAYEELVRWLVTAHRLQASAGGG